MASPNWCTDKAVSRGRRHLPGKHDSVIRWSLWARGKGSTAPAERQMSAHVVPLTESSIGPFEDTAEKVCEVWGRFGDVLVCVL